MRRQDQVIQIRSQTSRHVSSMNHNPQSLTRASLQIQVLEFQTLHLDQNRSLTLETGREQTRTGALNHANMTRSHFSLDFTSRSTIWTTVGERSPDSGLSQLTVYFFGLMRHLLILLIEKLRRLLPTLRAPAANERRMYSVIDSKICFIYHQIGCDIEDAGMLVWDRGEYGRLLMHAQHDRIR